MTLKTDEHGQLVQAARPYSSQTVAIGAASVQSAAFAIGNIAAGYNADGTPVTGQNNTSHIRVVSTVNCWIAFGANPVAAASTSPSIYIPAYTPEYFWVNRGEKLAVIQDSVGGTLNIGELVQ